VPVVTRRRSVRTLLVIAAGFPLLLAGGAAVLTVVIGQSCTGGGVGDAPSPVAVRDIPARMLAIYQRVGAQYKLPWEILAGIGKEECDHGQLPDPSCTPQPGAKGPGVANFAGASGPMQVGIGGAAGDEYDALRHFLPNPLLGHMTPPRPSSWRRWC
jgi:peptidoglycan DL-endopeptidase CwlO